MNEANSVCSETYNVTADNPSSNGGNTTLGTGTTPDVQDVDLGVANLWMRVVYMVIGSLGITGNAVVMTVILRVKSMRKKNTNIFILNQSILDCCSALMLSLTPFTESREREFITLADDIVCRLWLTRFPLWSFMICSTYNLVALTLERYLAIVHAVWHRAKYSKLQLGFTLAAVWLTGPIINIYFFTSSWITNGECIIFAFPDRRVSRALGVITPVFLFLIPIITLCICYGRMARTITGVVTNVAPLQGAEPTQPKLIEFKRARITRNIFKTLTMVTLCFFICWFPNTLTMTGYNFGWWKFDFNGPIYHITVALVFCNCSVNPFVYMAKYEQFQRAFRSVVNRRRVVSQVSTISTTAN